MPQTNIPYCTKEGSKAFCTVINVLLCSRHLTSKGTCKGKTSFAYLTDVDVDNKNVKKVIYSDAWNSFY